MAIDVALALEYLHHHYDIPIAHCDLKPSNETPTMHKAVQLGLEEQLGTLLQNTVWVETYTHEVICTAMESSYWNCLQEKDQPTTCLETISTSNLHSYAKMALLRRVMEIVDPQIIMEEKDASSRISQNTEGNVTQECLASILQIGVACSAEGPKERMDIKDVLKELQRIRNVIVQV
ncbi:unnamed protein product [Camellia sinensis]